MKKLLLIALVSLGALPAHGALSVLYSTTFTSPTYADGALVGQDSWTQTGSEAGNPLTVSNAVAAGTVSMQNLQDAGRVFGSPINSGSIFLNATFTVSAASANGDYFLHFGNGTDQGFAARLYAKAATGGFVMALGTGSGTATYGTTVLTLNTPVNVLVRYDFVAGAANDTGALFINPTSEDGTLDTAYVAATTIGTDAVSLSSVNLRQAAANAATVSIDRLAVSVPEASTAILCLLGAMSMMHRRR